MMRLMAEVWADAFGCLGVVAGYGWVVSRPARRQRWGVVAAWGALLAIVLLNAWDGWYLWRFFHPH